MIGHSLPIAPRGRADAKPGDPNTLENMPWDVKTEATCYNEARSISLTLDNKSLHDDADTLF